MSASTAGGPSVESPVRLGLIGDNIRDSRSPDLHRLAGRLCGLDVRYDLLIPAELGSSFEAVFDSSEANGMRGTNVTYPYKERVLAHLGEVSPDVELVGSANTVVFDARGPVGYNTDYSGFIAAYRARFGARSPGRVAIAGAGGVGRAIAFALAGLGASELRLLDTDRERALRLAAELPGTKPNLDVQVAAAAADAVSGVDGIVNCTPLGMSGKPGSAIPLDLLAEQRWAFDAVYTPVDTPFLKAAHDAGLETLSGYELFFHQGIKAFELFTGRMPPLGALRRQLAEPSQHREAS